MAQVVDTIQMCQSVIKTFAQPKEPYHVMAYIYIKENIWKTSDSLEIFHVIVSRI